jgi:hypothetical protein
MWLHCDNATGAVMNGGLGGQSIGELQPLPSSQSLFVIPDGLMNPQFTTPLDFTRLRAWLHVMIDDQAGTFRKQFITDVPGQAQTYEKKEREARQWTTGDDVTHPELYPFLIAEATIRSVTVAQVRGEVMTQVNLLTPLAAAVEGHRLRLKNIVTTGTTLPDMMEASVFDWESLLP